MKKIIIFSVTFSFFIFFNFALAQDSLEINFFYSKSCPHCAQEKDFLEDLEGDYPISINKLPVSENIQLLINFYEKNEVSSNLYGLVPVTFIDGEYFLGFNKEIGQKIESCVLSKIEGEEPCSSDKDTVSTSTSKLKIPVLGEIDTSKYSLPVLAVILGFFDGFNVCSLGALVLILALVLALRQRRKVLMFGGIFLLTTAVVYCFLIILWYQLFSILASYLRTMEILIGILGIGGGVYFLRDFIKYKKYGPSCKMNSGKGLVSKLSLTVRNSLKGSGSLFLVVGTVLLFAAVVAVVEFPCSAAIPVFFASVLAEAQLPGIQYLLYIIIFVVFYLIDEIIVFLIAFFTYSLKLSSTKFVTWITLVESLVLFLLGFYYLIGF